MSDLPVIDTPLEGIKRSWWHVPNLEPQTRQRILTDLAVKRIDGWAWRFTVMLTLSVVVAVMGLQLNSAAVVIGAMLLAPLMQPVLATAACVSMGLFSKGALNVAKVLTATLWCVAVGYVFGLMTLDQELTSEVLTRTRPDGKDLMVALAAGAAGAYATVRQDVSSSLPGVAVAVALVPPLGAIGITLEAGDWDRAWGATLLYVTNLAAIILVGVFVFVLTGFVPQRRLEMNGVRLTVVVLSMGLLLGLIAWPLVQASRASAAHARDYTDARSIVEQWKSEWDRIDEVDVRDTYIWVSLRGAGERPDDTALREQMRARFADKETVVEWIAVSAGTKRIENRTLPALTETDAESLTREWMSKEAPGAVIDSLKVDANAVSITAHGDQEAPAYDSLVEMIHANHGSAYSITFNWTNLGSLESKVRVTVDSWATSQGMSIEKYEHIPNQLTVRVSGSTEPSIEALIDAIDDLDPQLIVKATYLPLVDLTLAGQQNAE